MVQVGSQKYIRLFKFILLIFLNSQNLFNWLMDDCHLSCITKLEMEKKKKHWQRHDFLLAKIIAMPVRPLWMLGDCYYVFNFQIMIIVPTCLHFEAASGCFFGKFSHCNNNNPKKKEGKKKKKEKVVQSVYKGIENKCAKSPCFEAQKQSSEVVIFRQ
jgi:hypothetical protein